MTHLTVKYAWNYPRPPLLLLVDIYIGLYNLFILVGNAFIIGPNKSALINIFYVLFVDHLFKLTKYILSTLEKIMIYNLIYLKDL
jgi:hypothetical protein